MMQESRGGRGSVAFTVRIMPPFGGRAVAAPVEFADAIREE
jgi:hypothetical protein